MPSHGPGSTLDEQYQITVLSEVVLDIDFLIRMFHGSSTSAAEYDEK